MIGNPLALLGLLAVAVPVIIHLLGRHQSRVLRFPTLRFIGASRLVPTRRRRLSDLPLLLVRVCIVAAAAVALSGPWLAFSGRTANGSASTGAVSQAVIVDTSASMLRRTAGGATGVDSAMIIATALESASAVTAVIMTGDVGEALAGASAWLDTRPGSRKIVIVSDFQSDAIDSSALAHVPASIGIDLVPIPVTGSVVTRSTKIERPAIIAAPSENAGVAVAWRAVGETTPADTTARVAIIYRSAPGAAALARSAKPIDAPWMGALVARLERDATLRAAAATSHPTAPPITSMHAVARKGQSIPVVTAGRDGDRLLLFLLDDAASLTSVALNRALIAELSPPMRGAELDSVRISGDVLAGWEREATPVPGDSGAPTDARWFWIAALLMLALETRMRSRQRGDSRTRDVVAVDAPVSERAA